MGKIEKFYAQKKCWKLQESDKKGGWKDILDGRLMRHGEANLHIKSAKLLGHNKLRTKKGKC
jgi:hypothetical protein